MYFRNISFEKEGNFSNLIIFNFFVRQYFTKWPTKKYSSHKIWYLINEINMYICILLL